MANRPWFIIRLVCFGCAFCLSACAAPDESWNRVRETGVLRVGMDASFPPFESVAADGTVVGLDVDLAEELGRRLGVNVQFVANLPYDGLYDALTASQVDVVISALVINPARMGDFAYSVPYFDAGQVLVAREEERDAADLAAGSREPVEALAGYRLAVELGSRGDQEARRWAREEPGLVVAPYPTAAEALAAVAAGEADVALVDHVSALAAAGTESGLAIVGEPLVSEPYAAAVRRDSGQLLREINMALAAIEEDGTLEALTAEWLGTRPPQP